MRFQPAIDQMEQSIIDVLGELEEEYCLRKWGISNRTGIPEDVLTVLLKRLRSNGKIELKVIWDESTLKPNGSGYCLTDKMIRP